MEKYFFFILIQGNRNNYVGTQWQYLLSTYTLWDLGQQN